MPPVTLKTHREVSNLNHDQLQRLKQEGGTISVGGNNYSAKYNPKYSGDHLHDPFTAQPCEGNKYAAMQSAEKLMLHTLNEKFRKDSGQSGATGSTPIQGGNRLEFIRDKTKSVMQTLKAEKNENELEFDKRVLSKLDGKDDDKAEIAKKFVLPSHMLAISTACKAGNFLVSFRDAGQPSLNLLDKGAAAKGHEVLEKTIKPGSIGKAYSNEAEARAILKKTEDWGLKGAVGHWDKGTGQLRGFYAIEAGKAKPIIFKDPITANSEKPPELTAWQEAAQTKLQDNGSGKSNSSEGESWKGKLVTGDYDMHDMINFSGHRSPVPSESEEEKFIKAAINTAVSAVDEHRPVDRTSHNVVQHGPQYNYVAHMRDKEKGQPIVDAVAKSSASDRLAVCDNHGTWSIVSNTEELNKLYANAGTHLKMNWQDGHRDPKSSRFQETK